MNELYPNYGVLEQLDKVNHRRRFKAGAWRVLVAAIIVVGTACARTATEQPPEPTSTVMTTPEARPSPTAIPLAEKLFGGALTELTAEQAAHLDVWLPVMVSGLSRLAFNGFIDGKPLGAGAGSEMTGLSHEGYLVNLYPVEPTGVELHLQSDPESGQVALLPTIRNPESPDDGAVIVSSSTDSEKWNFAGNEPVIMTPRTENGAIQWSFDLETYVSVSEELEVTHFVSPGSGQWVPIEAGVDNWRDANKAWQEMGREGGVVFNQETGQIEAVGNEEGSEVTHWWDSEKGWQKVGVEVEGVSVEDREAILNNLPMTSRFNESGELESYDIDELGKVVVQDREVLIYNVEGELVIKGERFSGVDRMRKGEDRTEWYCRTQVVKGDLGRVETWSEFDDKYDRSGSVLSAVPAIAVRLPPEFVLELQPKDMTHVDEAIDDEHLTRRYETPVDRFMSILIYYMSEKNGLDPEEVAKSIEAGEGVAIGNWQVEKGIRLVWTAKTPGPSVAGYGSMEVDESGVLVIELSYMSGRDVFEENKGRYSPKFVARAFSHYLTSRPSFEPNLDNLEAFTACGLRDYWWDTEEGACFLNGLFETRALLGSKE